jgi:hypothetical protein
MSLTSIESKRLAIYSEFALTIAAAMKKAAFLSVATLLVAGMTYRVAHSSPINYPNPSPNGNTVNYTDVSENSLTNPSQPLFGPPTVAGDSIDFNPVGFGAFSAGGGSQLTDGQLVFKVSAKPGFAISNINFAEAGITSLSGVGTNNTFNDVSATGAVDITEVDGVGINTISIPLNLVFAPNANGTFQLVSDGPLSSLPWTGGQMVNLNAALTAHSIPFTLGATKISVDLDNGLIAQSENGTLSLIDKKDFGGLSVTVNTPGNGGGPNGPEPTSMVLACLGFGGLLLGRRRFC